LVVDGLDERDKVRVDIEISRYGTLASLSGRSMGRSEKVRFI